MKTTSELQFEKFLDDNKLPFERVEEQQTPRPDYLVQIGDVKVLFNCRLDHRQRDQPSSSVG